MRYGLQVNVSPRHLAEVGRVAEEVGFDTVFVPEHLAFPAEMTDAYPYGERPELSPDLPCYDPFAMLAVVAACTSRIRLATNVCIVPLHHPLFLARSLATLDRLSGGRVTLGAGVGWMRAEFDLAGVSFHDRGRRTDAIITLLRELWSGATVERHDELLELDPMRANPRPLQRPGIPIHVGGSSPAALRRAATLGDGWLELGSADLDELGARLRTIQSMRVEVGRDHLPFEVTTMLGADDPDEVRHAADVGVTRMCVSPPPTGAAGALTPDEFRAWAERFRDDVIARV